jgi:hypothetical protein
MGHAVLVYNPRAGRVLREPGIIGRIEGRAPAGVRRDPRDDDRGARHRGRDRPARDRCGRDDRPQTKIRPGHRLALAPSALNPAISDRSLSTG